MTSRLDRLFVLLDQGSSQVTRRAAALQLGEVQRLHPHELRTLLTKVRTFLHSSNWDTRIAAAQAVEAIIKNVEQWTPIGTETPVESYTPSNDSLRMRFERFNIDSVISNGSHLLASEGLEFELVKNQVTAAAAVQDTDTVREKLMEQRAALNQRLGLDVMNNLGIGIKSEDLVTNDELKSDLTSNDCDSISVATRSRNQHLKRRTSSEVTSKKLKRENSTESDACSVLEWPLEWFTDQLMNDLFNPAWEVRHGAATGLREVIKLQGKCGGRVSAAPSSLMASLNQEWLEDVSLRLLCVLALDKFGDFISDQVIAPVRETSAQALGSVFNVMASEGVVKCLSILTQLLGRPEWEARHGSLLGLKYLLAIRSDLNPQVLPLVFEPVFQRLKDPIDDVSAVAAAALVPVKDVLIQLLPDSINPTIEYLWDALLEIDDLTSSTSSILSLLSSLLTYKHAAMAPLDTVIPRLWPFFDHNLTSVRKSVLEALLTLLNSASGHFSASNQSQNNQTLSEENLKSIFCLLFQRGLIEVHNSVLNLITEVWTRLLAISHPITIHTVTSPLISGWICLMMHPSKMPIDTRSSPVWVTVRGHCSQRDADGSHDNHTDKYFLGGSDNYSEPQIIRERAVFRSRLFGAKLVGLLARAYSINGSAAVQLDADVGQSAEDIQSAEISQSPADCICSLLTFHLDSKSAVQRTCVALILKQWASAADQDKVPGQELSKPVEALSKCFECLNQPLYFDEMSTSFTRLQQETRDLVSYSAHCKVSLDVDPAAPFFPLHQISDLIVKKLPEALSSCSKSAPVIASIEEKCSSLSKSLAEVTKHHESLSASTNATLASASIAWSFIPDKLNPLIRPLMESIKKEENDLIQDLSADQLAKLLLLSPAPGPKVVKNLVTFLCSDPEFTPIVQSADSVRGPQTLIISLTKLQKMNERMCMRRSNSVTTNRKVSIATPEVSVEDDPIDVQEANKNLNTMRRGAMAALIAIVKQFGPKVASDLPDLWKSVTVDIGSNCSPSNVPAAQTLIQSLQVLEVIAKDLDGKLQSELASLLPPLTACLQSTYPGVRHMASRCLGSIVTVIPEVTMTAVIGPIADLMSDPVNEISRAGAVETISCIIESWGIAIVPYVVLLVVPMMARMSDQNESVRLMASHCFAQLIQLLPLDSAPSVNGSRRSSLPESLQNRKETESKFIQQLMDPKKLTNYNIPIPVRADLRSYQQDGVNWLAFLNQFKLHGILCDEMGLGKTLMSICILASHHHEVKIAESSCESRNLPSIVICPPTLTGHWTFEVNKFVENKFLKVLHYTGPPIERNKLKEKLRKQVSCSKSDSKKDSKSCKTDSKSISDLVVASYDIVRNDIEFFSSIKWNYCILDEGHIIKNGKTKLSKAIKSLTASHRLILTGTPIQNNVLELWSLFDFLMPGFLGTERQFTARFARPIVQSRDAKSSSKEQEAGVLAMEALHRQVLPFILRRMKSDVLKDLPPKIMQDYYCDLSPLQARLYEDFAKSRMRQTLEKETVQASSADGNDSADSKVVPKAATHIFQALQYLRKVCNHPKLVLTPNHPEYEKVKRELTADGSNMADIGHAAKLGALKQLLLDCGIGVNGIGEPIQPVVSQHRALIFCQLKSMLDIVENDLLKAHMPSVTYMRLDGSVPAPSRHQVVQSFNNDPSIDVLLLTTQVGGLGLNLTGADTIIFVEHDWNPMKDLQAMDRAHRIGQKKVVNVYRLITTGTLEEKIMGLQKFKISIANTVISHENSSLQTMGTDQLLELFSFDASHPDGADKVASASGGKGVKSILESLPALWDENAYENEYNLDSFISTLK